MYGIESRYALPTPRFGTRKISPPCSSTMFGVLSVELSTMRICAATPARSMPSLHHSMNSPTVISSFIAGMTMVNSTSSGVVPGGRMCSITRALFCTDCSSTCITRNRDCRGKARALFSEIERAFFEGVHVTNHQNRNKTEHAPEDRAALLNRIAVDDRPWIHEYNLEVEKDE